MSGGGRPPTGEVWGTQVHPLPPPGLYHTDAQRMLSEM